MKWLLLGFGLSIVTKVGAQNVVGSPTAVQTCPRYQVIGGRGTRNGATALNMNNTAAVTCCSPTRKAGWARPTGRCRVYAERDAGPLRCLNAVTWAQANAQCQSNGARLCTANQLIAGCGAGTGCQHDARLIWSRTWDSNCAAVMSAPTRSPSSAPPSTAPTNTPAPTPSRAPTPEFACPGYRIVSGSGGIGGICSGTGRSRTCDVPRYAPPTEQHEVTCCSDRPIRGFWIPFRNGVTSSARRSRCPVYSERDGGALTCLSQATWSVANAYCSRYGARLCTISELQLGCGAGSGCAFNEQMIWSSNATTSAQCPNAPTSAPVTRPPTMSPTPFNSCPGQKIVSGAGGTGGAAGDRPRFAGVSELHQVTCCSDRSLDGFAPPGLTQSRGNCTVWSERDALSTCFTADTFDQAASFCQNQGARLCTASELEEGCGAGLGCGANNHMVWSATANPNCNAIPAPTFAPTTAQPTGMPTPANYRCGYAVDCADQSRCTTGGRYADPSELHEVQCCSNTMLPNFQGPINNCTVWVERDATGIGSCFSSTNFTTAQAICARAGARLCNVSEVRLGCGRATGCLFDKEAVWTSTQNVQCSYPPGTGPTWMPTSQPTAVPTKAPTNLNYCPGYKIQSGRGNRIGTGNYVPRYAGLSEVHGVTCCSDTPILGFVVPNSTFNPWCPVYSERDAVALGGCITTANYSTALAFCAGGGARLCTAQELSLGCGVGTGCNHDARMIWSSDSNPLMPSCLGTFSPTAQPTALTPAPTRSPTQPNFCPGGRYILSGEGGTSAARQGGISRYADPNELHEVTCCSDTNISGFQAPNSVNRTIDGVAGNFCPVYAERDVAPPGGVTACGQDRTYNEAVSFCQQLGARLCTRAELSVGCGKGTGCMFDRAQVWSSTVNPYCDGNTPPPTTVPTTLAPTQQDNCPGYRIQWGSGGPGGPLNPANGVPRYASPLDLYAVTCCSDTPIAGFAAPQSLSAPNCLVYAERDTGDLGGCTVSNYPTALSFCAAAGARLCTAGELVQGCGIGTGCQFNQEFVWSSTSNPECSVPPEVTMMPSSMPTMGQNSMPTASPTMAPNGANSASNSGGGGSSNSVDMPLVAVAVILVIIMIILLVVLYKKSHATNTANHGPGFSNPLYAVQEDKKQDKKKEPFKDRANQVPYQGAFVDGAQIPAEEDDGGYMDLPAMNEDTNDALYDENTATDGAEGETGYMDINADGDDDY